MRTIILAAAMLALAGPLAAQPANGHNSNYFPGGAGVLVSGSGDPVTLGSGCTLANLVLTCSGSTGGSAVRAAQLEMGVPGNPLTTTPYYLTTYAELPGTITGAKGREPAGAGD